MIKRKIFLRFIFKLLSFCFKFNLSKNEKSYKQKKNYLYDKFQVIFKQHTKILTASIKKFFNFFVINVNNNYRFN